MIQVGAVWVWGRRGGENNLVSGQKRDFIWFGSVNNKFGSANIIALFGLTFHGLNSTCLAIKKMTATRVDKDSK